MFYLDKKQFLPAFILFSIIFLPITIIIACVGLIETSTKPLLITGILFLIYLLLIFTFLIKTKSQKKYLVVKEDCFEICCGVKYCDKETGVWSLPYENIDKIDYYRFTSVGGWLCLYTGILPRCVFITIQNSCGQDESVFIGYLDLNQVKEIASAANTDLIVH